MIIKVMNSAIADMKDIHRHIAENNDKEIASDVILNIKANINSLKELPNRGNYVKELEQLGITQYRELHYKPYRIIYSVEDEIVFIHIVVDGRRDMQSLLLARLMRI